MNADTRLEVVLRRHFSGFGLDEGRVHAQVLSVPGAFLKKYQQKCNFISLSSGGS